MRSHRRPPRLRRSLVARDFGAQQVILVVDATRLDIGSSSTRKVHLLAPNSSKHARLLTVRQRRPLRRAQQSTNQHLLQLPHRLIPLKPSLSTVSRCSLVARQQQLMPLLRYLPSSHSPDRTARPSKRSKLLLQPPQPHRSTQLQHPSTQLQQSRRFTANRLMSRWQQSTHNRHAGRTMSATRRKSSAAKTSA